MIKVNPLEKAIENFVTSTPAASTRYESHLEKKGATDPKGGALRYALGIISSSGMSEEGSKAAIRKVRDRAKLILLELEDDRERVEEWLALENVGTASEKESGNIKRGIKCIVEYVRVFRSVVLSGPGRELNREVFDRRFAFIFYNWESWQAARCSLLNATCGYYAAAFAVLRLSMEQQLRAGFYQCICDDNRRKTLSRYAHLNRRKVSLKRYLSSRITEIDQEKLETNSAFLLRIIGNRMRDLPRLLSVQGVMIPQLQEWSILEHGEKARSLYGRLSGDVHGRLSRTDIWRSVDQREPKPFQTPTLLKKDLSEYVDTLAEVTDLCCTITLGVNEDLIRSIPIISSSLAKESRVESLRELGMRLTASKLYRILADRPEAAPERDDVHADAGESADQARWT